MTVSLEEMLEEEDMLSGWLLGLNLLQRRSQAVASVQRAGIVAGAVAGIVAGAVAMGCATTPTQAWLFVLTLLFEGG